VGRVGLRYVEPAPAGRDVLGAEPPSGIGRELTGEPPCEVDRELACGAGRGPAGEPTCDPGRGVLVADSLREARGCSPLFSVLC
jgi:hypothetical protein